MTETKHIGMAVRRREKFRFREDRQEVTLQFSAALGTELVEFLDSSVTGPLSPALIELRDMLIDLDLAA